MVARSYPSSFSHQRLRKDLPAAPSGAAFLVWCARLVPTQLPPEGTNLEFAAFADSLY